ncbi:MAG: extradiol dioxygenase [Bacteroidetes bacterium]|nr:extradiol dioxygenase [Bacteroidota bacterium]
MITGAHTILYSSNPEADRAFLQNVLQLNHVDVGHGWLIFGLPPSEIAVHPADTSSHPELYLLCDNIESFVRQMKEAKISCEPVQHQRWGHVTYLTLPGGGRLGVYEPVHPRPEPMK